MIYVESTYRVTLILTSQEDLGFVPGDAYYYGNLAGLQYVVSSIPAHSESLINLLILWFI